MIFYSVTVAKCVAEIYAEVPDPVIRVLISDSDFQSYYHSSVTCLLYTSDAADD